MRYGFRSVRRSNTEALLLKFFLTNPTNLKRLTILAGALHKHVLQFSQYENRGGTVSKKIIFDTDIGGDCDDAGALALIHRLCDKGEAELLAVTHTFNGPYYAGCIDAINRYCGRQVPVGINYDAPPAQGPEGVYAKALCDAYENDYPTAAYGTDAGPWDTLKLLRKTLAEAGDHSVTLVATGPLHSLARLITSEADEFSPLNGKELVAQKVERTVALGGRFFESWPMPIYESGDPSHHLMTWEYNIRGSGYDNAKTVLDNWSGELVFASYEIGCFIHTMRGYAAKATTADPVALAYLIRTGDQGRCSWDHTAVLDAIRPSTYWYYHEAGRIEVDADLVTHWTPDDTARHTYLLPKTDYETIRQVIDDLLDGK